LGEEDERTVVDLLIEQIEFCDVIVLNKLDLIDDSERDRLMAILQSLNPRAKIEIATFGEVPLDRVLNTRLFDLEEAAKAPGWLSELRGEHVPETDEYGIGSFVWRARRPMHPQRFWDLVNSEWPGVVRSKGFFWLASRPAHAGSWSQAGAVCRHGAAGLWWAAVPKAHWPTDPESLQFIEESWHADVGDARQELVLIGIDMDEAALRRRLDACLLTDAEMSDGPQIWGGYVDPFPAWGGRVPETDEVA
jgi:G3E family GTPase